MLIYNLLIEFREPDTDRRLILEDDGQTGYAYLRTEDGILASVWLYNRAEVPDDPSWDDNETLPFPNKRKLMVEGETLLLSAHSVVEVRWDERGCDLYIDALLTARLESGVEPGWSRLAAVDSLVAKALPRPALRLVSFSAQNLTCARGCPWARVGECGWCGARTKRRRLSTSSTAKLRARLLSRSRRRSRDARI